MEKQLQRADKLASLGQISAGIAHEINNPLGVILGYSQLIKRSQPKEGQEYQDLQTIERQARNCKRIVEDLLKFARAAESKKASIDVNHCLREVVALLGHQFELDKIHVETRYDSDLPVIEGDGEKMKQVFMNLLMNARQAISGEGFITVSTHLVHEDGLIRIAIADDGCGIPQEMTERIFDPFFTTKPVGEGTGLGLSVSYGIIQDHGGWIEVSSREGHGSTFTIVLPAQAGETDHVTFPVNEEAANS
jgi:signal transduction histidine kinase